ncbi:MAG TPA: sugar phosphate isomerase/epimerase family protein [Thermodesulfobacteriota bacterium]|nr:sugar phosphate isomerase/epimerase family protein [Thermodesulfobacteriota bacterium]
MKFGYSTNAFVKYTLFQAIEKIAALGFPGIEIMCDRPHLYPPDFGPEALADLKNFLEQNKLTITNLNGFTLFAVGDTYLPSWIEPEKERREMRIRHTLDCLSVAHSLNCRNISLPPGGPLNGMDRSTALQLFRQGLEEVLPLAESLGVHLLVEPEPGLLLERGGQFRQFIKDFQSSCLGLNFDIGHFFCVGEAPEAAFEDLFPWIGHVHIEDIAPNRKHYHLIAGKGAIQFLELFKIMSTLGYNGDITLELYPYTDHPEEAGLASLDYLKPIFQDSGLAVEFSNKSSKE